MNGKKAKMLRRMALVLPPVQTNHLVTSSEIVYHDEEGNKLQKPMRKITKKVQEAPVNHEKNLKGMYKKHGVYGAYAYGDQIIKYNQFLIQQQKANEERNQNQEADSVHERPEEDSVLQVQSVADGNGGDTGSVQ
jgi:hypothetical protein